MPEEITIRKASADQWQLYKQIRLAALQDSPDAFGSSFEHESKLSDDDWKAFLDKGSNFFLAFNEDKPVGIIGYFTKADHPDSRYIFSMWVNENFRNKSIGKSLVQHVIEAATLQGADTVVTGYASSNPQARGFYEGLGFSETGRQIPLMRDPSVKEIEMTMEISTRTTRE